MKQIEFVNRNIDFNFLHARSLPDLSHQIYAVIFQNYFFGVNSIARINSWAMAPFEVHKASNDYSNTK